MHTSILHMYFAQDANEAIREAAMKSLPVPPADQPSYYWQIYRKSKSQKDGWVFLTDFQGTEGEVNDHVAKWYSHLETKVKQGLEYPKRDSDG